MFSSHPPYLVPIIKKKRWKILAQKDNSKATLIDSDILEFLFGKSFF